MRKQRSRCSLTISRRRHCRGIVVAGEAKVEILTDFWPRLSAYSATPPDNAQRRGNSDLGTCDHRPIEILASRARVRGNFDRSEPASADDVAPLSSRSGGEVASNSGAVPSASDRVTDPDWRTLPSGHEINNYFPQWAARSAISGSAAALCKIGAAGDLVGCRILREDPRDQAFGLALLRITSRMKMNPTTKSGTPLAG